MGDEIDRLEPQSQDHRRVLRRNLINDICYVTNGEVQDGAKDDVSYVHC